MPLKQRIWAEDCCTMLIKWDGILRVETLGHRIDIHHTVVLCEECMSFYTRETENKKKKMRFPAFSWKKENQKCWALTVWILKCSGKLVCLDTWFPSGGGTGEWGNLEFYRQTCITFGRCLLIANVLLPAASSSCYHSLELPPSPIFPWHDRLPFMNDEPE